jgi:hypothetical protein
LVQDNQLEAAEHVRRILELDSSFKPTIEQEKPDFVNLVAEIRRENVRAAERSQQNRNRKWVYIGAGGAAAAAVLVLVATAGGSSNGEDNNKFGNPLPEPPSFP